MGRWSSLALFGLVGISLLLLGCVSNSTSSNSAPQSTVSTPVTSATVQETTQQQTPTTQAQGGSLTINVTGVHYAPASGGAAEEAFVYFTVTNNFGTTESLSDSNMNVWDFSGSSYQVDNNVFANTGTGNIGPRVSQKWTEEFQLPAGDNLTILQVGMTDSSLGSFEFNSSVPVGQHLSGA